MGLPWVRLDTDVADHPKILELVHDKAFQAIAMWHFGLGYCGKHDTGGFIPHLALSHIHGRSSDADKAVGVGLWVPTSGGWEMKDYGERNPSTEQTQRRRERAQKGAAARWKKHREGG